MKQNILSLLVFALVSAPALAETAEATKTTYDPALKWVTPGFPQRYSSAQEACQGKLVASGQNTTYSVKATASGLSGSCDVSPIGEPWNVYYYGQVLAEVSCPDAGPYQSTTSYDADTNKCSYYTCPSGSGWTLSGTSCSRENQSGSDTGAGGGSGSSSGSGSSYSYPKAIAVPFSSSDILGGAAIDLGANVDAGSSVAVKSTDGRYFYIKVLPR